MKLFIDNDITYSFIFSNESEEGVSAVKDEFDFITSYLKKNSVQHKLEITDASVVLTIFSQKITIDEIAMNALFYNALAYLFDLTLCYSFMGSDGCDFAVRIAKAEEVELF